MYDTMKNSKNQPKTALGAVVVEMQKNVDVQNSDVSQAQSAEQKEKTPEKETTPKTLEEVLAENEQLRKVIENQPKTLQEKIDYIKKKEDLVKQLHRLEGKRNSIFAAFELVTEKQEEDEFFTDVFCLSVTHKANTYGKEDDIFKLNNPVVIGEVLQFAMARLDVKRDELQFLIES